MQDVLSINDIMNDKEKKRTFESIMSRYDFLSEHIAEVVPQQILDEYASAYSEAGQALRQVGLGNQLTGNLSNFVHMNAVAELANQTIEDLQASIRTARMYGISSIQGKLEAIQTAMANGTLAGWNRKKITAAVKQEFMNIGLTSFVTVDGRKLPLDFYSQTVTRTKTRQANTQAHYERYKENGVKYVQISHRAMTCHICAKRNGIIMTIGDHREAGVPHWEDVGLPPFHPNCRHTIRPIVSLEGRDIKRFNDNVDPRTGEESERYKLEQAIRRKANQEKKEWQRMRASGEEGVPNTLGGYRRMKRRNDAKWQDLQSRYAASMETIKEAKAINPTVRGSNPDSLNRRPPQKKAEPVKWTREGTNTYKDWESRITQGQGIYEKALTLEEGSMQRDRMNPEAIKNILGEHTTMEGLKYTFNPDESRFDVKPKGLTFVENEQFSRGDLAFDLIDKATGKKAGYIKRQVYYIKSLDKYVVDNALFELEREFQGKDMATNIYFKSEQLWRRVANGKPLDIKVTANIDVGVYAWTRHGFEFKDPDDIREMRRALGKHLDKTAQAQILADIKGGSLSIQDFEPNKETYYAQYYDRILNKLGYNNINEIEHPWQWAALDDGESYELSGGANIKGSGKLGKHLIFDTLFSWDGVKKLNQGSIGEKVSDMYYELKGVK
ncbi:putative minor capsid protein [Bacillus phage PBC5]|nr:putative minor capsid protein [Bacillus phage PBC5]